MLQIAEARATGLIRIGALRIHLLVWVGCAAFAQTAEKPAEWIRSAEPVKRAWAAHWIAEQQIESLVPELKRMVAELAPPDAPREKGVTDPEAAKLAGMDALIQLRESVPLADLEPLVDKFPTEVLILASRAQDNSALLLKLLDRPHNYESFVAIGNLLAPRRTPGFALRAMKEFCVVDQIWVLDPGQKKGGMGMGWAVSQAADPARTGWPETGAYRLAEGHGSHSWELLADGTHPISFNREPTRAYVDHGFDHTGGRTVCQRAEEFLASYLNVQPSQLPVHADMELSVTWTGDSGYTTAVRDFFSTQRAAYHILAQQLAARGFLSAAEAEGLSLQIRFFVSDARKQDRTTLPDVKVLTHNVPKL